MSIFRALFVLAVLAAPTWAGKPRPPAAVHDRQVSKADLQRVLAGGPQRMVAAVRVAPHLVKGRFVGFRLEGFAADGPFINNRDIRVGDVLISVNKEPLERPEQFMRAWELVQQAEFIELVVLRGADRLLYRWKITP
jgi:type II secretory pathway component PulC